MHLIKLLERTVQVSKIRDVTRPEGSSACRSEDDDDCERKKNCSECMHVVVTEREGRRRDQAYEWLSFLGIVKWGMLLRKHAGRFLAVIAIASQRTRLKVAGSLIKKIYWTFEWCVLAYVMNVLCYIMVSSGMLQRSLTRSSNDALSFTSSS